MFVEAAAYLKSKGMSPAEFLDELYLKHGLFLEKLGTLTFEGAEGASKIKKLLESYKNDAPSEWLGLKTEKSMNFNEETFRDIDGKEIPKELMLMFYLSGGTRIVVRGSGTEPKIKFYFLGKSQVPSPSVLEEAKATLKSQLDALWDFTQKDVERRIA